MTKEDIFNNKLPIECKEFCKIPVRNTHIYNFQRLLQSNEPFACRCSNLGQVAAFFGLDTIKRKKDANRYFHKLRKDFIANDHYKHEITE